MSKTKKHILHFDQEYDFELIGICSHHNDYRLAWAINEQLGISLIKTDEEHLVTNKKGEIQSQHSKYVFKDAENLITYYLVKNKGQGKYLIPEKPTIDYFLFLYENHIWEILELNNRLKEIPSVLGAYIFEPIELQSTEHIVLE